MRRTWGRMMGLTLAKVSRNELCVCLSTMLPPVPNIGLGGDTCVSGLHPSRSSHQSSICLHLRRL